MSSNGLPYCIQMAAVMLEALAAPRQAFHDAYQKRGLATEACDNEPRSKRLAIYEHATRRLQNPPAASCAASAFHVPRGEGKHEDKNHLDVKEELGASSSAASSSLGAEAVIRSLPKVVRRLPILPSSGWNLATYHVHPLRWATVDAQKCVAHMHTWHHYHRERNLRDMGYSEDHCGDTTVRVDDDEHDLVTCMDEVSIPMPVESHPLFSQRTIWIGAKSDYSLQRKSGLLSPSLKRKQTVGPGGRFASPLTSFRGGRYKIVGFLGSGASSIVLSCQDLASVPDAAPSSSSGLVAVKVSKAAPISTAFLLNEITVMMAMQRNQPTDSISQQGKQHILPLLDSFFDMGHACMVVPQALRSIVDEFHCHDRYSRLASAKSKAKSKPKSAFGGVSVHQMIQVARQMLLALAFLEQVPNAGGKRGIYHGDLKPDNILVVPDCSSDGRAPILSTHVPIVRPLPASLAAATTTSSRRPTILSRGRASAPVPPIAPVSGTPTTKVVLSDFGLSDFGAMKTTRSTSSYVQTRWLRAPEVLLGTTEIERGCPMDMWSLGCTLIAVFTGSYLFCGDTARETLLQIADILSIYGMHVPDEMVVQSMYGPEWFMGVVPPSCDTANVLPSLSLTSSLSSLSAHLSSFPSVVSSSSSSSFSYSSSSSSSYSSSSSSSSSYSSSSLSSSWSSFASGSSTVSSLSASSMSSLSCSLSSFGSLSSMSSMSTTAPSSSSESGQHKSAFSKPRPGSFLLPRSGLLPSSSLLISSPPLWGTTTSSVHILTPSRTRADLMDYHDATAESVDGIKRRRGLTLKGFLKQNPEFRDGDPTCQAFHDLILSMLQIDPRSRIRPRVALYHPLFGSCVPIT